MKRTSGTDSYFKFVFGQTARTEKNVPKFWDLTGTGNTKLYFFPNATPPQCGAIYAQINGTGTTYAPDSAFHPHPGDVIQFNYYDTNYLNTTMIYYTAGGMYEDFPDPGVNDSSTNYITQTPAYGGVFVPYTCSSQLVWYTIAVVGVRYGYIDSDICYFNIQVSN